MKKLFLLLLLSYVTILAATAQSNSRKGWDGTVKGGSVNLEAQSNFRKGWDGTVKGGSLNFGASSINPFSDTKKGGGLSNSIGINGDVYVNILSFRKGWDGTVKGGSFGINFGVSFGDPGNPNSTGSATPQAFAVAGQTGASTVAYKVGDGKQSAYRIGAGPQVNFYFGEKVNAGFLVRGEYFSMSQSALSAVQTTSYNGTTSDVTIWKKPATKTSGFAIAPALRLNYMFTPIIGLYIQASYIAGPTIKTTAAKLIPEGNPEMPGNIYKIQQLQSGKFENGETIKTPYSAMTFGGGLVIAFGKRKGGNEKSEAAKANINTSRSNIKQ